MINKRGRMIAIIGGGAFILIMVLDSMDKKGIGSKESFYDTFNSAGDKVSVGKKKKKSASLRLEESEIMESAESFQKVSGKKDEAFSLYEEILRSDVTEVVETIIENDDVEPVIETEKIEPKPRVVYVERPKKEIEIQEVKPAMQEKVAKERKFTRVRGRKNKETGSSNSSTIVGSQYYKAEIFESITVDMQFPQTVRIRLLQDIILPDGRKVSSNTLLKGIPGSGQSTLPINIPEYGLTVYNSPNVKGIPLSAAEGLKQEGENLKGTEIQTNVNVPLVGNIQLSSGRKNQYTKVTLQESRPVYLKWEN